jgi:hypothetical protein
MTIKNDGNRVIQLFNGGIIAFGGWLTFQLIKNVCKKRGLDTDKVDRMTVN